MTRHSCQAAILCGIGRVMMTEVSQRGARESRTWQAAMAVGTPVAVAPDREALGGDPLRKGSILRHREAR